MTAPKRLRSTAKPKPVPAAQLSDMEIRVALAFRDFKPGSKEAWAEMMQNIARDHRHQAAAARPARALRLVSGGAR